MNYINFFQRWCEIMSTGQAKFKYSEITPKHTYLDRRDFIQKGLTYSGLTMMCKSANAGEPSVKKSKWSTTIEPNSFEDITNYNNFKSKLTYNRDLDYKLRR